MLETNVKIAIKTDIVDDRSDPLLKLELNDGRDLEVTKIISLDSDPSNYKNMFSFLLHSFDNNIYLTI